MLEVPLPILRSLCCVTEYFGPTHMNPSILREMNFDVLRRIELVLVSM
jgi:hypothetical protein